MDFHARPLVFDSLKAGFLFLLMFSKLKVKFETSLLSRPEAIIVVCQDGATVLYRIGNLEVTKSLFINHLIIMGNLVVN